MNIEYDLDLMPYSAIALVQTKYDFYPNVVGFGTAFLISASRLATAGHVFWSPIPPWSDEPLAPDSISVFVGEGLFAGHEGLDFTLDDLGASVRVHPGFVAGDPTKDIATIDLPGAPTAPLPLLGFPADLKLGETLTMSGYPVDGQPFGAYEASGALGSLQSPVFDHRIESSDGDSGAPIRVKRRGTWQVVGIHLGEGAAGTNAPDKRGLALTADVLSWLHAAP